MCGICRTVNCIRRRLFGCGCGCSGEESCDHGCDNDCRYERHNGFNSRYAEPDTNIICANQRSSGFTPCCDDDDCRCHKHHHNGCGCD